MAGEHIGPRTEEVAAGWEIQRNVWHDGRRVLEGAGLSSTPLAVDSGEAGAPSRAPPTIRSPDLGPRRSVRAVSARRQALAMINEGPSR